MNVIAEIAPEVFKDKHTSLKRSSDEVVAVTSEVVSKMVRGNNVDTTVTKETTIPLDPNFPISIGENPESSAVGIYLPFANTTARGDVLGDGTTVFDHQNGSSSTPVVKEDGSVQITTVISISDAPTRYAYESAVAGADSIEQLEGGGLIFRDAEGRYLAGIAPAWAKDASGIAVPTWYEVDGKTITQVVDHASQSGFTYPIVADPYMGSDLFAWVTKGSYNGQPQYNAQKSAFGNAWHYPGKGYVIFANEGWNEVKAKQPGVLDKSSLKHQYDCHVTGGFGDVAGTWNLEQSRYDNPFWAATVWQHLCNW